uniref:ATP synthase F0 subunit 8 n=1 Tax=Daclera levana TaxID=2924069 RepID=UPI001FA7BBAD|nr:ATP synthase F0 subunit 8 [Daclera levana]UMY75899.1 ATP synthase F0 subunit 8 [Daclera levana]
MPQMASLWWELLFMFFIITFMLMNTIIYYNKLLKFNKKINNKFIKMEFNWKW